jgi:hypothetical protein
MIAKTVGSAPARRSLPLVFVFFFSLLAAGCGGGGGSSPTTHTVTATAGAGGSISPASAMVNDGATTSFTVTPDSGYAIDSVAGCGGSLNGTAYTTGAVTADCTVTATFSALPTVSVADATVLEGDSGTTSLVFTVTLSGQANGLVNVDYATSDGTATAGSDYTATSATLIINSGTTSNTVTVTVNGDNDFEPDETFTLTLSNVSANAVLGTATATGAIFNDDPGGLNDTGITRCGDYAYGGSGNHQNNLNCTVLGATATGDGTDSDGDPVPAGQDAHFGRDVTANDYSDGRAGFSFTKVCNNGAVAGEGNCPVNPALGSGADDWGCTLDNVTGLMWEVKTYDGGLRDKDWTYTWYNSTGTNDGGDAGTPNGGWCVDVRNCDTEKFVAAVNAATLCGHNDWRLPTAGELASLVDSSIGYLVPTIDTTFFPITPSQPFWSSSPDASYSGRAWLVNFDYGRVYAVSKVFTSRVRLVRAGQ